MSKNRNRNKNKNRNQNQNQDNNLVNNTNLSTDNNEIVNNIATDAINETSNTEEYVDESAIYQEEHIDSQEINDEMNSEISNEIAEEHYDEQFQDEYSDNDFHDKDFHDEVSETETESLYLDDMPEVTYGSFAKDNKKNKKSKKDKKNSSASADTENLGENNKENFSDFSKEFFGHIKSNIVKNKKIFVIALSAVALIAIVSTLVYVISSNVNKPGQSVSDSATDLSAVSDNTLVVPDDPYETDAYPEVNALILSYFVARQSNDVEALKKIQHNLDAVESAKYEVLSKYIDEYTLKNCYTKKGPFENSYMVYATFDVKMSGYDVLAPGLQTFVVCTAEDGSLYIYSGDFDTNVADYISEISAQSDVIELMNKISVEYNDILASNTEFSDYMNQFKPQIKSEIGEKIAELEVSSSGDETSNSDDNTPSDAGIPANPGETPEETSFTVKTTTSVNVRKSDSENADKIDTVGAGAVLICNEQKPNGWSEVEFNGQIGYIKSDYLVKTDGDGEEITTNGIVMINETIKIRKEANTDSDSLGVGYAGQTFEKIETLDNGWTKILFEGQEAYIKSEFIVQ